MSAERRALRLEVNGVAHEVGLPDSTPLLNFLRNDLHLNGPKFGCGLGECGACAVLIDGDCVRACVVPIGNLDGRRVVTLEGLGDAGQLHPVQQAFITAQAAQCGYCLNGMIIATHALLALNREPSELEIREALRHHLCRCGTHLEILEAVRSAAAALKVT